MQTGRGGMGSHKHGIAGHSGPSPRFKMNWARDDNNYRRKWRRKKTPLKFKSVREALRKK